MRRDKQVRIRTRTKEVWLVRFRRGRKGDGGGRCGECQAETDWLTLADVERLSGVSVREIFRLIEAGAIHFRETGEGRALVCARSLVSAVRTPG